MSQLDCCQYKGPVQFRVKGVHVEIGNFRGYASCWEVVAEATSPKWAERIAHALRTAANVEKWETA